MILALVACGPKPGSVAPALPTGAGFVLTWDEVQHFGLPDPLRVAAEERWTPTADPPPGGASGVVWTVVTAHAGVPSLPVRMLVGPEGLYRIMEEGVRSEVPADAKPGDAWEDPGRSCAVEATPFCTTGVAVACLSRIGPRTVWLRQHWCPEGWVGFEAVSTTPGAPAARYWSEGAARDGVPLPAAALPDRAVPLP